MKASDYAGLDVTVETIHSLWVAEKAPACDICGRPLRSSPWDPPGFRGVEVSAVELTVVSGEIGEEPQREVFHAHEECAEEFEGAICKRGSDA